MLFLVKSRKYVGKRELFHVDIEQIAGEKEGSRRCYGREGQKRAGSRR